MKKLFQIAILVFTVTSCKAQSPVIDVHTARFKDIENAYYKDIENFYGQFVGTWVYSDNSKTIRFRFIKKEKFYYKGIKNYYRDFLVGEMQYIENGVEKINSLNNLNSNHSNLFDYSMSNIAKIGKVGAPVCTECPEDVKRLVMQYDEPTNDDLGLSADFVMRTVTENGVEKLKIQYIQTDPPIGMNKNNIDLPSTTTNFTIPYGNYTLVKEN